MNVSLRNATTHTAIPLPGVDLFPSRYSWHYHYGPDQASVSVRGDPNSMFNLMSQLGREVIIRNEFSLDVWWGILYSMEIRWGSRTINVSLGSLSNRVVVKYTLKNSKGTAKDKGTAWVTNDDSIARYGTKELKVPGGELSDAAAEGLRDWVLAQRGLPRQVLQTGQSQGGSASGLLTCKGWFSTLNWRYYYNASKSSVSNEQMISDIITDKGQFLIGSDLIETYHTTVQTRDGARQAGKYVIDLMNIGVNGATDAILIGWVSKDRVYRTSYGENLDQLKLYVDERDIWRSPNGTEVPKSTCPVGLYFHLQGVPSTLVQGDLFPPSDNFIARSEYDVASRSLTVEPLLASSPFNLTETE